MFQVQLPDGTLVVVPTEIEHRGPEAVEVFIREATRRANAPADQPGRSKP